MKTYRLEMRTVESGLGANRARVMCLFSKQEGREEVLEGSIEVVNLAEVKKALAKQTKMIHKKYILFELWEEFQNRFTEFCSLATEYLRVCRQYKGVSRTSGGLFEPTNAVAADFVVFLEDVKNSALLREACEMCSGLQESPDEEYVLDDRSPIKKRVEEPIKQQEEVSPLDSLFSNEDDGQN